MRSWRGNASERELLPSVCTPPRDDLATRPRLVQTPRDSQFKEKDSPSAAVTQQACSILLLVGCIFGVSMAVLFGLYAAVSTMVADEVEVGHCEEQPITNGYLKAGFENSTAVVRCDPGYGFGKLPKEAHELRCTQLAHKCIVVRRGTLTEEEVRRCSHIYGFTLAGQTPDSVEDKEQEEEEALAEARLVADSATLGACIPNGDGDLSQPPSRLFGQSQQHLEVTESASPPVVRAPVRWTVTASSFAMSGLMLTSLVTVVCAGIGRARVGSVGIEPDSAVLMADGLGEDVWDDEDS